MEANFELKRSVDGTSLVLCGIGEFDLAAQPHVLDAAAPALALGQTVVLDLKKVTFIDASALRTIAVCANTAACSGARFNIRHAWGQVADLLHMTGFTHLMVQET
jgi:anti-anti-sigma factor